MLQKRAMKIVLGSETSYADAIKRAGITSIAERREETLKKFAASVLKNSNFSDQWFPKKNCTRNPRQFAETRPRTERMKKNPITFMKRILNSENPSLYLRKKRI